MSVIEQLRERLDRHTAGYAGRGLIIPETERWDMLVVAAIIELADALEALDKDAGQADPNLRLRMNMGDTTHPPWMRLNPLIWRGETEDEMIENARIYYTEVPNSELAESARAFVTLLAIHFPHRVGRK